MKAVEFERTAFLSSDPLETALALIAKEDCYKQCGRFTEAAATLSRVPMYCLSDTLRAEVLHQKELCHYLAGEFDLALSAMEEKHILLPDAGGSVLDVLVLNEASRWEEARDLLATLSPEAADIYARIPRLKSEKTAFILAFIPPLGHFYTGRVGEGLLSLALNLSAAGFGVWQVFEHCWLTGWLGGAVALDYTYLGGIERATFLTRKYNHDLSRSYNDSLRSAILSEELPLD